MRYQQMLGGLCLLLLNSCGLTYFNSRDTNPVVWDSVEGYAALSTDAQRRTIFVRKQGDSGDPTFVCAEPPPDVAQAYASAISAVAKGSGGKITVELSGGREAATAALPLMYRSQGLQYRRDSLMSLCLALMNGTIRNADYIPEVQRIDRLTLDMVKAEMKAVEEAAKLQRTSVQVSQTPKQAKDQQTDQGSKAGTPNSGNANKGQ